MKTDLYEILDIPKKATQEEIKKAYRKQSRKCHPDLNNNIDNGEFNQITTAYGILSNPDKKRGYDKTGRIPRDKDDIEKRAADELNEIFAKIINDVDYKEQDILGKIGGMIKGVLSKMSSGEIIIKKKIKELRKAEKDLKHKGKGPNYFKEIIINKLKQCEGELMAIKEKKKEGEIMQTLLKTYEFPEIRDNDDWEMPKHIITFT